jgi:hypothetical protein
MRNFSAVLIHAMRAERLRVAQRVLELRLAGLHLHLQVVARHVSFGHEQRADLELRARG